MAKWDEIQRSFSGGEIGGRMLMRDNTDRHASSVIRMVNFMPTLQGPATRTPGTRFVQEITSSGGETRDFANEETGFAARIIPYLTPDNKRALVVITPTYNDDPDLNETPTPASVNIIYPTDLNSERDKDIVRNYRFDQGFSSWLATPGETNAEGEVWGWEASTSSLVTVVKGPSQPSRRPDKRDKAPDTAVLLTKTLPLPRDTTSLTITPDIIYEENFSGGPGTFPLNKPEYTAILKVGTTVGAQDVWVKELGPSELSVAQQYAPLAILVQAKEGEQWDKGQSLFLSFSVTAIKQGNQDSTPRFRVREFRIQAPNDPVVIPSTISGDIPTWGARQLQDLQFVQSPYPDSAGSAGNRGNELVLVQTDYAPRRILFDGAEAYTMEVIPFSVAPSVQPPAWGTPSEPSYPSACTSFMGRLVVAGGQERQVLNSTVASAASTVWSTRVGVWNELSDPEDDEITPNDPIEFTTTYRSPIEWVFGQKTLLVGAEGMEYSSSADGIYAPGDLGVAMHSTHGSARVQPVGMGQTVLFPAENGRKVREMRYLAEDETWVAPDKTLAHPNLFDSGITRMVRLRNPHQIVACVMGNGKIALLHEDTYAEISGWSRISLSGDISDACVITNTEGVDELYVTIWRNLEGEKVLYLEKIVNWVEGTDWDYVQSALALTANASRSGEGNNIWSGLDHLEDKILQVTSGKNYLGDYRVTDGAITLVDQLDQPIVVSEIVAGLSMAATMTTLPLVTDDAASQKRYVNLYVRTLGSSRPIINGERVSDRRPANFQDESQSLDLLYDNQVAQLGWNVGQPITITETAPVRTQIVGIFGTVKGNSL